MRWKIFTSVVGCLVLGVFLGFYFLVYKNKSVSIKSTYPGHKLEKTANFKNFLVNLDQIGFWKQNGVMSTDGRTFETAKSLQIILTDVPQNGLPYIPTTNDNTKVLSSFDYSINNDHAVLTIHVDIPLAEKLGIDPTGTFNVLLIQASYMSLHHDPFDDLAHARKAIEEVNEWDQKPFLHITLAGASILDKIKYVLVPLVLAQDCASWKCATIVGRCDNLDKSCSSDFDCQPGGTCKTNCGPAGEFSESGTSCSYGCPSGSCIVSGSTSCSCAGGSAPPPPPGPSCTCSSWSDGGCGGMCGATDKRYYRSCSPGGCDNESSCNPDTSCGADTTEPPPDDTVDPGAGGPPPPPPPPKLPPCDVDIKSDTDLDDVFIPSNGQQTIKVRVKWIGSTPKLYDRVTWAIEDPTIASLLKLADVEAPFADRGRGIATVSGLIDGHTHISADLDRLAVKPSQLTPEQLAAIAAGETPVILDDKGRPIKLFDKKCGHSTNLFVGCTVLEPAKPKLKKPKDKAILPTNVAQLEWDSFIEADWGLGMGDCPGTREFKLYVGQGKVGGTPIAILGKDAASFSFNGKEGKTYLWKVLANNGSNTKESDKWTFTLGQAGAWFNTTGGDVASVGEIQSYIPAGVSPRSFSLAPGPGQSPGVVYHGGTLSLGGAGVSEKGWHANQALVSPIDLYKLLLEKIGTPTVPSAGLDPTALTYPAPPQTPPLPAANQVYFVSAEASTSGIWNIAATDKVVYLVDGNVTIGGEIHVAPGGFFAIVASGNITVLPSVGKAWNDATPSLEGVYITGKTGIFTAPKGNAGKERLTMQGTVSAGDIILERTLVDVGENDTTPAESFIFNPTLWMNAPPFFFEGTRKWEEVVP